MLWKGDSAVTANKKNIKIFAVILSCLLLIGIIGVTSFADGEATVSCGNTTLTTVKGESLFIPADSGKFTINGKADFLETRI